MNPIRIAILGDSWGVPNYFGGSSISHHHIEWLLKFNGGHVVTNFSRNGGSNLETLQRLYDAFDVGYKCDLVIWFHTEPLRDVDIDKIPDTYKLRELNDKKAVTIYKFASQVKYKSDCKWLVIGGQAPINKTLFDKLSEHEFIKYDWRSELAGEHVPESPAWGRKYFLENEKWADTDDVKNQWLDIHLSVQNQLYKCSMFPDGGHPGAEAHEQLFNWMEKEIFRKI